jgi:hypothetical protein
MILPVDPTIELTEFLNLTELTPEAQLLPRSLAVGGDFNIFFGAGISRDAPTNGPIWNEMQAGFLSAVFDRMEAARWRIASYFAHDRPIATTIEIRPELFWRQMLEHCGRQVVLRALQAAAVGTPNRNHELIAHLLSERRCSLALTPNFDEHIESVLPDKFPIEVPTVSDLGRNEGSAYVKLHGTISKPDSLCFTLEQYDDLNARNSKIMSRLAGKPLLVAGYSGYDSDILPALRDVIPGVPLTVIIKHPGSNPDQPIFGLATEGHNVRLVEARCVEVLSTLAGNPGRYVQSKLGQMRQRDSSTIYREAAQEMPIRYCPIVLVITFQLCGAWESVERYGWLAHEACCDDVDREAISPAELRRLHLFLAYALKLAGDVVGSRVMIGEAKASLRGGGGNLSDAMSILREEALVENAPNLSKESAGKPPSSLSQGLTFTQVRSAEDALRSRFGAAGRKKHDIFTDAWESGIAKQREGDLFGAIEAFDRGAGILIEAAPSHLEQGRFLLDYGNAMFAWAMKEQSADCREKANTVYRMCERVTYESQDWATNAKAHLMLGKIFLSAEQIERSQAEVTAALGSVSKTKDVGLRARIQEFSQVLHNARKTASQE